MIDVPTIRFAEGIVLKSVSPDGRYLSAGPLNTEPMPFRLKRVEDGKILLDVTWTHGADVHYTADASRVLVAEAGGLCRWYKLPSGEPDGGWELNIKREKPKFTPDLGLFAGASDGSVFLLDGSLEDHEGAFHLIDGQTGRVLRSFDKGNYAHRLGGLSADGRVAVLAKLTNNPKLINDKNRPTDAADVIDTTTGGVVAELKLPGGDFIPTVLPDGSGMLIRSKGSNPIVTRFDFVPVAAP